MAATTIEQAKEGQSPAPCRCLACDRGHREDRPFCSRRCRETYQRWAAISVVAWQRPTAYLLHLDKRTLVQIMEQEGARGLADL